MEVGDLFEIYFFNNGETLVSGFFEVVKKCECGEMVLQGNDQYFTLDLNLTLSEQELSELYKEGLIRVHIPVSVQNPDHLRVVK
jgi:hypothetical protein